MDADLAFPRLLDGRVLTVAAIVLAAVSLLIANTPTYDPWAWLDWGREIDHLDLSTLSGPQFKPLPVAVAALITPLGSIAPSLWLIVARATGFLALAGAVRLGWRVHGWSAAVLATLGVVTAPLFVGYLMPYGMSEPMLLACFFWAADQHLRRRYGTAFWLLVAASLLRPEMWPFLIAYALLLAYRRRMSRLVLLVGLLIVPLAWFVPEWIGSGDPLRTGQGFIQPGAPRTHAIPGLAVATGFAHQLLPWVEIGAVLGVGYALLVRDRILLALTGIGAGWLVVVAALTQLQKSTGTERYLYVTFGVAALLAGVGWSALGAWVVQRLARIRLPQAAAAVLVGLVVLAVAVPSLLDWKRQVVPMAHEVKHQQGETDALPAVIERAGGRDRILACGRPWAMRYRTTQLAWELNIHMDQIESWVLPGRPVQYYVGVMFQTEDTLQSPLLPEKFYFFKYQELARSSSPKGGEWIAVSPCAADQKAPAAS